MKNASDYEFFCDLLLNAIHVIMSGKYVWRVTFMDYVIRKREKRDCKDIAHVVTVSWNETYKGIVSDDFLKNLYKSEEVRATNALHNFDETNNHQFVLEIDHQVVGFINVGHASDSDYPDYGEICALYIVNGYKGNGFGKKLVEAGIDELKKMGFEKMIIACLDGNRTNEFYKHIGGKFAKTRMFEVLGLPENVYVYEKI